MNADDLQRQPEPESLVKPTIFEQKVIVTSLALAILCILLFAWVALSVEYNRAEYFDRSVRDAVHRFQSPGLDKTMVAISFLGADGLVIAALAAVILFLCFRRRRAALWLLVTMSGTLVLDLALKYGFHRPRPVPFFGRVPLTPSFPSGHALFSFSFYGVLAGLLVTRTRLLSCRLRSGVSLSCLFLR